MLFDVIKPYTTIIKYVAIVSIILGGIYAIWDYGYDYGYQRAETKTNKLLVEERLRTSEERQRAVDEKQRVYDKLTEILSKTDLIVAESTRAQVQRQKEYSTIISTVKGMTNTYTLPECKISIEYLNKYNEAVRLSNK
jgi:hypothetical protein